MRLNPIALLFWLFVGLVGYLVSGDVKTGILCGTTAMGFSLFLSFLR